MFDMLDMKKARSGILALIVCKYKEFADEVVEDDNQDLRGQGYNGIDGLQVMVDKLSDDFWELGDKEIAQSNV